MYPLATVILIVSQVLVTVPKASSLTSLRTFPVGRHYTSSISHPTPTAVGTYQEYFWPADGERDHVWFIRKHIQFAFCSSQTAQTTNPKNVPTCSGLLVCFQAIMELHLSKNPQALPFLDSSNGDSMLLKHVREWDFDGEEKDPLSGRKRLQMREIWSLLRNDLDAQRITSLQLDPFRRHHLATLSKKDRELFSELTSRFHLHLRTLEIYEASLRDRITDHSSNVSTIMAGQSIKESKRVILCELL